MRKTIIATAAASLLGWTFLCGQNEFYNDGANVYIQAGALVYVQGEVVNDDQAGNVGRIFNSGDLQLTGNWTNTSASSNVFQAFDPGTTTFLGNNAVQTIGGTLDTYFNNLTINKPAGTFEVRQLRNSLSDGVLNLTNDFLNTQTFTFLVANPNPAAITRTGPIVPNYTNSTTEGYVTSTPGSTGRLARATSTLFPGGIYFYPVGTSNRFRPVEITPTSVGNNVYTVQYVDLPTFSTNLKQPTLSTINPAWYHFIERAVSMGSPENIRIYHDFTADDVCDINNVTMAEWNLALWADLSPTTSTQNPSPTLSWTQRSAYPGTYPTPWVSNQFALAGLFIGPNVSSCVFPVELTKLSATALESTIRVDWEAASQSNNMGWFVERSLDGRNFNDIGWIDGAGTTVQTLNYDLEDLDVVPGVLYYYRLRQMDFDGGSSQSEIVSAMLAGDGFSIGEPYPNPSAGLVNIPMSLSKVSDVKVSVVNMLGQELLTQKHSLQSGYQVVTLNLSELAQGVYHLTFNVHGKRISKKVVID